MKHVNTQDPLADLLTKPLFNQRTELLKTKIGLADGGSILQEHIKEDPLNTTQDYRGLKSSTRIAQILKSSTQLQYTT